MFTPTEREEFRRDIREAFDGIPDDAVMDGALADALLALGYRKNPPTRVEYIERSEPYDRSKDPTLMGANGGY